MDFIEKISLKESNGKEKDAVLYNVKLTDEQKLVLYNELDRRRFSYCLNQKHRTPSL